MKSLQGISDIQSNKFGKQLTKFTKPAQTPITHRIWLTGKASFDDYDMVKQVVTYMGYRQHMFFVDDSVGLSQIVLNVARAQYKHVYVIGKNKRPRNNAPSEFYIRFSSADYDDLHRKMLSLSNWVYCFGDWSPKIPKEIVEKSGKPLVEVTKGAVARKHNLALMVV